MLDIEDKLAIHDLYARYCWANDAGDAEAFSETFLQGGQYHTEGRVVTGRGEIRALMSTRIANRPDQPFGNPQHWTGNLLLDGGDDGIASGRCYFVRFVRLRDSGRLEVEAAGWYDDELAKVDGAWGFRVRRVVRDIPGRSGTIA